MQEVNNTVDVFKDDIDMYINLWMEERSIEDMCKYRRIDGITAVNIFMNMCLKLIQST